MGPGGALNEMAMRAPVRAVISIVISKIKTPRTSLGEEDGGGGVACNDWVG
jgi:hypothetical protein